MSKKKTNKMEMLRSSAAEYLSFVAATGEGGVEVVYADENIWLSQKMMGVLYQVETHTINYHLKKVFSDNELDENSVIRKFRITAEIAKAHAESEFEKYRIVQDRLFESDFDKEIKKLQQNNDNP
jgi:hypothetical protein